MNGSVYGVDLKGTKTAATNLATGTGTVTTEVVAGKGNSGVFTSQKVNSSGSQTDVGLKISTQQTNSFTFTFKAGVTIQKDEKK